MFTSILVGASPRMGKTIAARLPLLAAALDLCVQIHIGIPLVAASTSCSTWLSAGSTATLSSSGSTPHTPSWPPPNRTT